MIFDGHRIPTSTQPIRLNLTNLTIIIRRPTHTLYLLVMEKHAGSRAGCRRERESRARNDMEPTLDWHWQHTHNGSVRTLQILYRSVKRINSRSLPAADIIQAAQKTGNCEKRKAGTNEERKKRKIKVGTHA